MRFRPITRQLGLGVILSALYLVFAALCALVVFPFVITFGLLESGSTWGALFRWLVIAYIILFPAFLVRRASSLYRWRRRETRRVSAA